MSEFENQLNAAIEREALEYFLSDPELRCDYSFKAGANLLKPLLMKAIEQRNRFAETSRWTPIVVTSSDEELIQMMDDL